MPAEARDLGYLNLELGLEATPRTARRASLRAVEVDSDASARQWAADVSHLPARLIGGLPRLTLRMRSVDGAAFHFTTSAVEREILEENGAVVLEGAEWEALVLAAEADRAWPADLVRTLRTRGATGRISAEALLDGVTVDQARRDAGSLFTVGRVLERLGARMDAVSVDETDVGEVTFP